jgi:putative colanic acid biosynthesis acetyltransferase WcaF
LWSANLDDRRPKNLEKLPRLSNRNRLRRLAWSIARILVYRPTPVYLHRWRAFVLSTFGARIEGRVYPYPDIYVWAPWNLYMAPESCIGPGVICYNVCPVQVGRGVTVSQRTHLCTASHDFDDPMFLLIGAPIILEEDVWIAAETFIGPGVTIGENAVVLARAVVVRDVPASAVMAGNPARYIRSRNISKRIAKS